MGWDETDDDDEEETTEKEETTEGKKTMGSEKETAEKNPHQNT